MKPRLGKVEGVAFGKPWHAYRLDCDCTGRYSKRDPHKLFGVTTALKTLSKDALTGWASRITAEYAVDHWDELDQLGPSARLQRLKDVQYDTKNAAAIKGNKLHEYAADLAAGRPVDVPEDARSEVELLARWMDREEWESWGSEVPVANTQWKYGGTLDNIGRLGRRGLTALVDFKRQPRAYEEVAWQLAGYRYADLAQLNGPASEGPMPEVDGTYVVLIKPDSVELLPVETDQQTHREFLYMLQVARAREAVESNSRIGVPLAPLPEQEDAHVG